MFKRLCFSLLFLLGLSTEAKAQSVSPTDVLNIPNQQFIKLKDQLSFCAHESNDKIRLICYESAIHDSGIPTYNKTINDSNGIWVKKSDERTKVWTASLQSVNSGSSGNKTLIVFRCDKGQSLFYIKYGSPVGSNSVYVNIGQNDSTMGSYNLKPSENEDALGLWDNNQAVIMNKFIASLPDKLIVKTHFKGGSQTDLFYLTGSQNALIDVRRACGW